MPIYNLHHTGYVSRIETIEADNPDAAMDAAQDGNVSLCHQCTREWEPEGDSEITSVTDETGEIVWEPEPARPLPTREQVRDALNSRLSSDSESELDALIDAVMATMNGGGS
jgi:hypothetical protein